MTFRHCTRHMANLTDALKRKGMGHLMTDVPAEVEHKTRLWLAGAAKPEEIDPRIVAILEINNKVQEMVGHTLNGHRACPLCEVNKILQNADADASWIDNITDLMLITCRVNGLIR